MLLPSPPRCRRSDGGELPEAATPSAGRSRRKPSCLFSGTLAEADPRSASCPLWSAVACHRFLSFLLSFFSSFFLFFLFFLFLSSCGERVRNKRKDQSGVKPPHSKAIFDHVQYMFSWLP